MRQAWQKLPIWTRMSLTLLFVAFKLAILIQFGTRAAEFAYQGF